MSGEFGIKIGGLSFRFVSLPARLCVQARSMLRAHRKDLNAHGEAAVEAVHLLQPINPKVIQS